MEKDSKCLDKKIHIKFNDVNFQKRGAGVRWVYHCEGTTYGIPHINRKSIYFYFSSAVAAESAHKVFTGDLVVVRSGTSKFFAYVTEQQIIRTYKTSPNL